MHWTVQSEHTSCALHPHHHQGACPAEKSDQQEARNPRALQRHLLVGSNNTSWCSTALASKLVRRKFDTISQIPPQILLQDSQTVAQVVISCGPLVGCGCFLGAFWRAAVRHNGSARAKSTKTDPRKLASDRQIPWHNLAHFCCQCLPQRSPGPKPPPSRCNNQKIWDTPDLQDCCSCYSSWHPLPHCQR